MVEELRNTIELLKNRVIDNLKKVKENENEVRNLMNYPFTGEREKAIKELCQFNKEILAENKEAINIQMAIIKYLSQYRKELQNVRVVKKNEEPEEVKASEDDYFALTITGILKFDQDHPMYNDPVFYEKLLNYFISHEDYEMCTYLTRTRKSEI